MTSTAYTPPPPRYPQKAKKQSTAQLLVAIAALLVVLVVASTAAPKLLRSALGQSAGERERLQQIEAAILDLRNAERSAWSNTESARDFNDQVQRATLTMLDRLDELATGNTIDDVVARSLAKHTRDTLPLMDRYRRLSSNAERMNAFDMASARSRRELERNIAVMQQGADMAKQVMNQTRTFPDMVRSDLREAGFRPHEVDRTVSAVQASMRDTGRLRMIELDGQVFEYIRDMGKHLLETWGTWSVDSDGMVLFERERDIPRFNRLADQLQRATAEAERLLLGN
ncbi:MAG: hypothetical protein ACNA8P_05115 [Phycisphaerales bacterium]